jgi:chemotaxis protein histidine kinase CheA
LTSPDDIVAAELARLSAEFVAQLPAEVRAVEDEVTAWLDRPEDPKRFEIVSHRVHQLKGSGSTFGCPGISRAARLLEQRIGTYRRETDAGKPPAAEEVESAVAGLQNEAIRVRKQSRDPEESG